MWDWNDNCCPVYQQASIALVKAEHPTWSPAKLEAQAQVHCCPVIPVLHCVQSNLGVQHESRVSRVTARNSLSVALQVELEEGALAFLKQTIVVAQVGRLYGMIAATL